MQDEDIFREQQPVDGTAGDHTTLASVTTIPVALPQPAEKPQPLWPGILLDVALVLAVAMLATIYFVAR